MITKYDIKKRFNIIVPENNHYTNLIMKFLKLIIPICIIMMGMDVGAQSLQNATGSAKPTSMTPEDTVKITKKLYGKVNKNRVFKYLFPNQGNVRVHKAEKLEKLFGQPDTTYISQKNELGEVTHFESEYHQDGKTVMSYRFEDNNDKYITHIWVSYNEGTYSFFDQFEGIDRSVLNFFHVNINDIESYLDGYTPRKTTIYNMNDKIARNAVYSVFKEQVNRYLQLATRITFVNDNAEGNICDKIIFVPNY